MGETFINLIIWENKIKKNNGQMSLVSESYVSDPPLFRISDGRLFWWCLFYIQMVRLKFE